MKKNIIYERKKIIPGIMKVFNKTTQKNIFGPHSVNFLFLIFLKILLMWILSGLKIATCRRGCEL
jgi:hypothetical protein